jgi:hypothetical protein
MSDLSAPFLAAVLRTPRANYAALSMPLAGTFAALAAGNQAAAVFALIAFVLWLLMYWLPTAIAENDAACAAHHNRSKALDLE